MQEIIASVDHIKFDLEIAVEQQLGAQPLPFPGMDKSGAAVCEFFLKAACGKGGMCPFRHISGEKTVVCKHWLRGLCKKGDQCEFLHEYDMTKMPECYFYSKFGECSNKECPFLHIDPESKIKDCPWYDRGFCKHVSPCVLKFGLFCSEGKRGFPNTTWSISSHTLLSSLVSPRFELPMGTTEQPPLPQQTQPPTKQSNNPPLQRSSSLIQLTSQNSSPNQQRAPQVIGVMQSQNSSAGNRGPRPLEQVTCYKCGEKGHYANRCTKGHLAFLSGQ
ncbi:Cleavage and polyadenylation specificity factor subunit 4 [Cricetulus griseus]|uniref:Cleavage and polyadenylation specificity factor subunit 4 n=1 Tax=Cricetulus griseus TaxID=10029 RepID=G3I385_CRIGR|nr:Cleavage and polyadenylation specificity factor subunit 4 [Cricetulus griseus]